MNLDIDGILEVTAIEKETGKTKQITIENALQPKSDEEIAEARKRLEALYDARTPGLNSLDDDLVATGPTNEEDKADNIIEIPFETIHESRVGTTTEESEGKILEFDSQWGRAHRDANNLLERSRRLLGHIHLEDQEDAIELHERIDSAIVSRDTAGLNEACEELKELLFFVEDQ
jgi:molecular chaperone DnaK (HSP70)